MSEPSGAKAAGLARMFLILAVVLSLPPAINYVLRANAEKTDYLGLYRIAMALGLTWCGSSFAALIASVVATARAKRYAPLLAVSLVMLVVPPAAIAFLF